MTGIQVYEGDDATMPEGSTSVWVPTPEQRAAYCRLIVDRSLAASVKHMDELFETMSAAMNDHVENLLQAHGLNMAYVMKRSRQIENATSLMLDVLTSHGREIFPNEKRDERLSDAYVWLSGDDPEDQKRMVKDAIYGEGLDEMPKFNDRTYTGRGWGKGLA